MNTWRYEIQYGPEGEANYAWLYFGDEMVATMKTHHAVSVCAALAAADERGRSEERERCENERALAVVEALKAGWLKGRKAWCPAAILEDHERTNRDWQKAFVAITKEPTP